MDIQPKMVDAPDAVELDEVKGDIEFRDVWFSYIPGEWVLQGVVPCEPPGDSGPLSAPPARARARFCR